jgi:membrane protease YdiL (CAAX protease family)
MQRLRGLLAFLAFIVVEELVAGGLRWLVFQKLKLLPMAWTPSPFIVIEAIAFAGVIAGTLAAMAIQRRRFGHYGFAPAGAGRQLLAGSAWGLAAVAATLGAIAACGGFTVSGFNLHGSTLLGYAAGWLIAMFVLGLAEEATFRATGMFTLGDAIGIWPAAVVTTLIFSALHYFGKPHESIADALSVGLLGLFMAFTIIRTRSIWWAVGFHALFDYAALVVAGAPNTGNQGGQPLPTRLLATSFHGKEWLTGGVTGIEASWLIFPVIAVLFIAFDRVYRSR